MAPHGIEFPSIERLMEKDSKKSARIEFLGSPSTAFTSSAKVVVSFPGVHGYAWTVLTHLAAQGTEQVLSSCVFLPDHRAVGYGTHILDAKGFFGACHCNHLYPGKPPIRDGCFWYILWMERTLQAARQDCELIVVTMEDGDLGNSQKAEVRFLQDSKLKFQKVTIREFADMVLDKSSGTACPVAQTAGCEIDLSRIDFQRMGVLAPVEEVEFLGSSSEAFMRSSKVVVSFPGRYGYAKAVLTRLAARKNSSLLTICVFIAQEMDLGYGKHILESETLSEGRVCGHCYCQKLYGKVQPWGCFWFAWWKERLAQATKVGAGLIVVSGEDGSLGDSQQGEVEFLRSSNYGFRLLSISEFANFVRDCESLEQYGPSSCLCS
ncbi:klhl3 [Symbiodinium natans]|uniref:Klhl3 protein n=1 Tax=Symbiodinium natans TaxID=878477 RepID=A0A812TEF4_9DINO|nr:klhl3 [Symbiodinium natans]